MSQKKVYPIFETCKSLSRNNSDKSLSGSLNSSQTSIDMNKTCTSPLLKLPISINNNNNINDDDLDNDEIVFVCQLTKSYDKKSESVKETKLTESANDASVFKYYTQEDNSTLVFESDDESTVFHNQSQSNDTGQTDKNEQQKPTEAKDLNQTNFKYVETYDDSDIDDDIQFIYDNNILLKSIEDKLKAIEIDLTKDDATTFHPVDSKSNSISPIVVRSISENSKNINDDDGWSPVVIRKSCKEATSPSKKTKPTKSFTLTDALEESSSNDSENNLLCIIGNRYDSLKNSTVKLADLVISNKKESKEVELEYIDISKKRSEETASKRSVEPSKETSSLLNVYSKSKSPENSTNPVNDSNNNKIISNFDTPSRVTTKRLRVLSISSDEDDKPIESAIANKPTKIKLVRTGLTWSSDDERETPKVNEEKNTNKSSYIRQLSDKSSAKPSTGITNSKTTNLVIDESKEERNMVQNQLNSKRTTLLLENPESASKKRRISPQPKSSRSSSSSVSPPSPPPPPPRATTKPYTLGVRQIQTPTRNDSVPSRPKIVDRDEEGHYLSEAYLEKKKWLEQLKKPRPSMPLNLAKKGPSKALQDLKSLKSKETAMLFSNKNKSRQIYDGPTTSLTQTINIAKQQQQARLLAIYEKQQEMEKQRFEEEKRAEKESVKAPKPWPKVPNPVQSTNNPPIQKSHSVEATSTNRVENQVKPKPAPKPTKENSNSAKPQPSSSGADKNDILGNIMNIQNKGNTRPVEQRKPSSHSNKYIIDHFLYRLLRCTYNWLVEQDKYAVTTQKYDKQPPVVDINELIPVIDNYLSYDDYYKTMFPLLLSETWEDIFKNWRDIKNDKKTYQNMPIWLKAVDKIDSCPDLVVLTCQTVTEYSPGSDLNRQIPSEEDLIRLNLGVKVNNQAVEPLNLFGIIYRVVRLRPNDSAIMGCVRDFMKSLEKDKPQAPSFTSSSSSKNSTSAYEGSKNINALEFLIYVRFRKYSTSPGMEIEYELLMSLSSSFRRIKAMLAFQNNSLSKVILNGDPMDPVFWFNHDTINKYMIGDKKFKYQRIDEFNESQKIVIMEASSIVNYPEAKLYFIQGPPGTGKSHTIVGIIEAIFARFTFYKKYLQATGKDKNNQGPANFKILLCSPSNGNCDELCRRLVASKKKKTLLGPDNREISMVRVGRQDIMHEDCQSVSLDCLFRKKYEILLRKKQCDKSGSLRMHFEKLMENEKNIKSRIKILKESKSGNENQLKELEDQFEEIIKKKKNFENQLNKIEANSRISSTDRKKLELEAKEMVLREADIIISTLNFSGNQVLDCLSAERNNGNSMISAVIVDEAAQCCEVDCLIPLRFGCNKMIQVGDPEQLPATVLSKIGQDHGFAQSLFERIYQRFRFIDKNPIRMLYVQYRMHPDICTFPSKNFYRGKLLTDKETAKTRTDSKLRPYLVFNVEDSREIGEDGSTYNPREAEEVIEMCKYLSKRTKYSIGIITPYQKQTHFIRELLTKNSLTRIECGTVDGYQGREKDIILYTSVRANDTQTIGFLSHRQRLNVSLTRAKYALYIFCHINSLKVNKDWENCLEDAKERGLILNIKTLSE